MTLPDFPGGLDDIINDKVGSNRYSTRYRLGDLVTKVKRQFGDESGVQIIDSDIIGWANEGVNEIATQNKIWETTAAVLSVNGTGSLDLPRDLVMLEAVNYDTNMLTGINFEQLLSMAGGDIGAVGTPSVWYIWAGQLVLYPAPNVTGKSISIYYRGLPPAMTGIGDFITVPDKYFDTLITFVMSKAYELDEDWQPQQVQRNQFNQNVLQLKEDPSASSGDFFVVTDAAYETGWV